MQMSKSAVYKGMMLESVRERGCGPTTARSENEDARVDISLDVLAYSTRERDAIPEECGCWAVVSCKSNTDAINATYAERSEQLGKQPR